MPNNFAFSQAAENNKQPIAEILKREFSEIKHVLEIGSCTGQHAVYMAQALPHLTWQPSDVPAMQPSLNARIKAEAPANAKPALSLDVSQGAWPLKTTDAVYAANVIHIISKPHIDALFHGIGQILEPGGRVCLYGPFKYDGKYTSLSNANFDLWLKNRDPLSGIRDFEYIDALANAQGLRLHQDYSMPANNQLIVWIKT